MSKNEYTADNIKLPSDTQHIFMRPGMYIGDTDNPKHLFVEATDNAIDEAMNGYSNLTEVSYDTKSNEIIVIDHGRGIPHGMKEIRNSNNKVIDKMSVLEILMTRNNSGGKFDNDSFKIRGGLHGLGMKIINALSDHVWIQTRRDGEAVTYESKDHGVKVGDIKVEPMDTSDNHGTEIHFTPTEDNIFEITKIPKQFIIDKCEIANAFGYKILLTINGKKIDLGEGNLSHLLPKADEKTSTYITKEFSSSLDDGESVRALLEYTSNTSSEYNAFTNLLFNSSGGTHVYSYQSALMNAWKPFIGDRFIKPSDVLLGSKSVIAVFIEDPLFSSQTKERLSVPKKQLENLFKGLEVKFHKFLEDNKPLREALLDRFEEYRMSQSKLQSQKEIDKLLIVNDAKKSNGKIRRRSVVPKLKECTSKDRKDTELYITEGDSACLRSDTKVRLVDGRNLSIKAITDEYNNGKLNYVYTMRVTGSKHSFLEAKPIEWAGITRKNSHMIRVHIDNGTYIDCTPDHKFMLVNGTFKEARNLNKYDSLMIMPMTYKGGHLIFKGSYVHDVIAKQYGKGLPEGRKPYEYAVHHIDEKKTNNTPDNLKLMKLSDHSRFHAKERVDDGTDIGTISHYLYNNDTSYRKRQKEIQSYAGHMGRGVKHNEKWDDHQRKITSETTKRGMEKISDEKSKRMKHNQRLTITLALYKTIMENDSSVSLDDLKNADSTKISSNIKVKNRNGNLVSCPNLLYYWKGKYNSWLSVKWDVIKDDFIDDEDLLYRIHHANHKVSFIENLDETEDVYDLTVKDNHNFCLSNDVFVHNCGSIIQTRDVKHQAVFPVRGKVLNVAHNTNILDNLKNQEVQGIVNSIGASIGDKNDYTKSRYDRIIISADSDFDGFHIQNLLASLFINLLPDLVKNGMVYLLQSPLYGWTDKKTKKRMYGNNLEEAVNNPDFTRYKGLGEMDAEEFYDANMNTDNRKLVRLIYPDDVEEFNRIMTESSVKKEMLEQLGLITTRVLSDDLDEKVNL